MDGVDCNTCAWDINIAMTKINRKTVSREVNFDRTRMGTKHSTVVSKA